MISRNNNYGVYNEIDNFERALIEDPEDKIRSLSLATAYIRIHEVKKALFIISNPEIYKIVEEGYQELLRMMKFFDIFDPELDKDIPTINHCMKILCRHLISNPSHIDEIKRMEKPVFQLVPVYETGNENLGFKKLELAFSKKIHTNTGQTSIQISPRLERWKSKKEICLTKVKIIRWKLAISEGVENLSRESNPYIGQEQELQLRNTHSDYKSRKLKIIDRFQYILLQMYKLCKESATEGIDTDFWTVISDPSRKKDSWVVDAGWVDDHISFSEYPPYGKNKAARFRCSIVIEV